ncbi:hypothetical protein [Pseudomonas sp. EA_5y_Pfl2_R50]|uniref:hypothetical protein n=1 Tax=Pseudomonas sp. EA_5y_Pfl2_R50 TaxID=3088691 RepID=UPI0030D81D66
MSTLKFSYRDAKGDLSQRELIQWSENSVYIQGRSASDTFPKTYRKDRIIEVLLGAELLLNEAAPPSPSLQHNRKQPALVASEAASRTPHPKMSPSRMKSANGLAYSPFTNLKSQPQKNRPCRPVFLFLHPPSKNTT